MNRWTALISRAATEAVPIAETDCAASDGTGPDCRFAAWQAALARMAGRAPIEQIAWVHHRVNQLRYVSDRANWGEADRWETPLELFQRGGDCEDFALTKYFALRRLGFEDAALRLAVVWDKVDQEEHAILLVSVGDSLWLLDNKAAAIEPAAAYADRYRLIYSLNADGVMLPTRAERGSDDPARMRLSRNGRALVLHVDRSPRKVRRDPVGPVRPS